MIPAQQKQI